MQRQLSAPAVRRRLNDVDVFRIRGVAHGRVPHSRGAPSLDGGSIGRVTPSTRTSHHGHGLRPSLAFDPLPACPSLQAGQRRADHDRGETFPPRTTVQMSTQLVRARQRKPMEDGWAPTLARTG